MRRVLVIILSLFFLAEGISQWSTDPNLNTPVCVGNGTQSSPSLIIDQNGNTIICWIDTRNEYYGDIYAQKINSAGISQWEENGVPVCIAPSFQSSPRIVSDGGGGAVICWTDIRTGDRDIYAQKISSDGMVMWGESGIALSYWEYDQYWNKIIPSNDGGAIVTWTQHSWWTDVMAQMVDSSGVLQWGNYGVPVCSTTNAESWQDMISDQNGGVVVVYKSNISVSDNIYVKKLNSYGNGVFTTQIATGISFWERRMPIITSDQSGGEYIVWSQRNATFGPFNLYAQHIDSSGTILWATNGIPVCSTLDVNPDSPRIVCSESGELFVTWQVYNNTWDVYVQKITPTGEFLWSGNGFEVNSNASEPSLWTDGNNGVIITWTDSRNGTSNKDVYAQRINSNGSLLWDPDGVVVTSAPANQIESTVATLPDGNAVISWIDSRNSESDIYAQRVLQNGILPVELTPIPMRFTLSQNYPNPFNPSTKISWQSPVGSHQTLKVYDVLGREVATLVNEYRNAGSYEFEFNGTQLASGVYYYQLRVGDLPDGKAGFVETRKMILIK